MELPPDTGGDGNNPLLKVVEIERFEIVGSGASNLVQAAAIDNARALWCVILHRRALAIGARSQILILRSRNRRADISA
jgi:hypothetical protein